MVLRSCVLLLCVLSVWGANFTDKQYASMPQLFLQDNYDHCMMYEDEALYCSIQYELEPLQKEKPPASWKTIQEVNSDPFNYRHDHLRHWICVKDTCPSLNITPTSRDDPALRGLINNCYDKKFKPLGYKGAITEISCDNGTSRYPINVADILFAIAILAYLGLVAYGTYFEAIASSESQENYDKIVSSRKGKILTAFSIKKNWFRLVTVNSTPDVERLRCIQGMRVYNMALVILSHTVMTYILIPLSNTRYTETMIEKGATIFLGSGPLCVATFFVMSSFLLTYGLFDYFRGKEMNFKFLVLAFLNRYVRLTPTLLVMVGFHATWFRHLGSGPFWHSIAEQEYLRCRKNWWTNILYINNLVNRSEMCLQTTWYLALDTQYFAFLLILLWLLKKCEKQIWLILGFLLLLNMSGTFWENYSFGFPGLHLPTPESLYMIKNTISSIQWHHQLTSIIGNTAPPLIGVGGGYIFYKMGQNKIFNTKNKRILWWLMSWGAGLGITIIPGLLILRKTGDPNPFWASINVALSRPVFATAMVVTILGVSEGIGWFNVWALEWRPTYVLGRLTFSSYLVHMPLILLRPSLARYSVYTSDYFVVTTLLGDLATTYLAATILTLVLEMPISELQKLLVPQKARKSEKLTEKIQEDPKSK